MTKMNMVWIAVAHCLHPEVRSASTVSKEEIREQWPCTQHVLQRESHAIMSAAGVCILLWFTMSWDMPWGFIIHPNTTET